MKGWGKGREWGCRKSLIIKWFRRLANGRTEAGPQPIPVDKIPWYHVPESNRFAASSFQQQFLLWNYARRIGHAGVQPVKRAEAAWSVRFNRDASSYLVASPGNPSIANWPASNSGNSQPLGATRRMIRPGETSIRSSTIAFNSVDI
jgi:hypothetical protein